MASVHRSFCRIDPTRGAVKRRPDKATADSVDEREVCAVESAAAIKRIVRQRIDRRYTECSNLLFWGVESTAYLRSIVVTIVAIGIV